MKKQNFYKDPKEGQEEEATQTAEAPEQTSEQAAEAGSAQEEE